MQKKVSLHIIDLDCGSCVMIIDGDLEDLAGVYEAQTNYSASRTDVLYDPQKITTKKIIAMIKKSGYSASVLQA